MSYEARIAWLAGLWDGEGSVGVCLSRSTGTVVHVPQIQINMTHRETLVVALECFAELGCTANLQTIKPSDPVRHQVSYYFALRRTAWLLTVSTALAPYAVTKREHWYCLAALCAARIERLGLVATGGALNRGGLDRAPYTEREVSLVTQLRLLNASANNRSKDRMESTA